MLARAGGVCGHDVDDHGRNDHGAPRGACDDDLWAAQTDDLTTRDERFCAGGGDVHLPRARDEGVLTRARVRDEHVRTRDGPRTDGCEEQDGEDDDDGGELRATERAEAATRWSF